MAELRQLPEQISLLLSHKKNVQKFANRYLAAEHVFFIGRGIDYAISLEGLPEAEGNLLYSIGKPMRPEN